MLRFTICEELSLIISRRKRRVGSARPFPSQNFGIRLLDRVAILAGIVGPIMTLPQIYDIYHFHSAVGISILTWVAFAILDIPLLVYGLVHKDKLICITYTLWILANGTVACGAIMYH